MHLVSHGVKHQYLDTNIGCWSQNNTCKKSLKHVKSKSLRHVNSLLWLRPMVSQTIRIGKLTSHHGIPRLKINVPCASVTIVTYGNMSIIMTNLTLNASSTRATTVSTRMATPKLVTLMNLIVCHYVNGSRREIRIWWLLQLCLWCFRVWTPRRRLRCRKLSEIHVRGETIRVHQSSEEQIYS